MSAGQRFLSARIRDVNKCGQTGMSAPRLSARSGRECKTVEKVSSKAARCLVANMKSIATSRFRRERERTMTRQRAGPWLPRRVGTAHLPLIHVIPNMKRWALLLSKPRSSLGASRKEEPSSPSNPAAAQDRYYGPVNRGPSRDPGAGVPDPGHPTVSSSFPT